MAWNTPKTWAQNENVTASTLNAQLRDNLNYLNDGAAGIFTNEAARDSAIPSPVQGMRAYLTAATVPAATGDTTAVPGGVQTIYNGSVWVCVTSVGAYTQNAGTSSSSGYTATLGGSPGTNPTVTLVTGTTALVSFSNYITCTAAGVAAASVSVSGASTVAASNAWSGATSLGAGQTSTGARTFVIPGLTAGTNIFTMEYDAFGSAAQFEFRSITVQGVA